MATPYIGEIRLFAGNFAPAGWMFCSGQLLPISTYTTLFALLGTTYGGDGQSTFALPDMRSRIPMSQGTGSGLTPRILGETGGSEAVTLTSSQMPSHTHSLMANSSSANTATSDPTNQVLATSVNSSGGTNQDAHYLTPGAPISATLPLNTAAIGSAGNSLTHSNIMPVCALNYIIAFEGIFPSSN